jgi:hypothetical protein
VYHCRVKRKAFLGGVSVRRTLGVFVALLLVCASSALAADINGKWHAQVPWPGKNLTDFYFNFTVDGGKVTGTVTYAVGDGLSRLDMLEGRIDGNELSFAILNKMRDVESKWSFKGSFQDREIAFTLDIPATPPPAAAAPPAPGAPAAPAAAAPQGPPPGGPQTLMFTARRGTF